MNPFAHLESSLSSSRVSTYPRCPLTYFFQYVEKREWEKISAAMILGHCDPRRNGVRLSVGNPR
jgi:hypothetical protein